MKIIEHSYGADLNWVKHFAAQIGGEIDGNFIIAPDEFQSGTRYFLECGEGIVAYYINVEYKKNFHLIQKNLDKDFVGFYYNLTDGEASVTGSSFFYNVGRWQYNMAVIDSTLESTYKVKAGSKTFALCIFIKKNLIEEYTHQNNIEIQDIQKIIDPTKNTMIRFDRMSDESFHLLDDLRKMKTGGPIFDLNLTGTVHMLISNYLKKIASNRIIIQTVNKTDLATIINMQMYLIEHVEDHFPSIKLMAYKSGMSESKFKNLFRKITGKTPSTFFMDNKLLLSKELLEANQLSIKQVSDRLNFTNNSYFASKFKSTFGMPPKVYIKQL